MRDPFLLLIALFIIVSCNNVNNKQLEDTTEIDTLTTLDSSAIQQETALLQLSKQVLTVIKANDFTALVPYIHPDLGLRFSPYGYIDSTGIVVKRDDFVKTMDRDATMHWGSYDGTGEDIELTPKAYFKKFVYDVDFLTAEKTTINRSSTSGNSINNILEVYPGGEYTESYFSGFNEEYSGMDWRALRLVFKKSGNQLFLVAIVHDQWTV